MTANRVWSPQQEDVFHIMLNPRGGNILVEAVAGSGKTTTLVELCERMTKAAVRPPSIAFCAYNRKIAEEIKVRVADLKNVKAGTFHSFGYLAWSRHIGTYLKPDANKVKKMVADPARAIPEDTQECIIRLVSLAKQHAFGVLTPIAFCDWRALIEHHDLDESLPDFFTEEQVNRVIGDAMIILQASTNAGREVMDFDDQLYLPLIGNARMWQNDVVLVDEAQDTNVARRLLARKMLRPGGRLVAVGDPHQAIYGFTGADNDALDLIVKDFGCTRMPLNVSYRCARAVVRHAQDVVSHIHASPDAPEGTVGAMDHVAFERLPAAMLTAGVAVLCRNVAPLVDAAFKMIRRGIGCRVEGREIGQGLINLANRWKSVKTLPALADKLSDYLARETSKLMAKGQEVKAAALEDRVATLLVIIESLPSGSDLRDLAAKITSLFADTADGECATVILSTIHKSKGREWTRVYLIGRDVLMPSKYARQAWQLAQERNLEYVAITRAKATFVEVALPPKRQR